MSFKVADRVLETSTTTGTGTFTLAGAVSLFQTFNTAISDADTCSYFIAHQTLNEWETGIGTFTSSGTTLARSYVIASSNSNAAVNFSAGTKNVGIAPLAKTASNPVGNSELRLSLTSGLAVTTADVTAAGNIYWTPDFGNRFRYFNGYGWITDTTPELSLAITATSGLPYDIFVYNNAGTLTLASTAWTNVSTRATALTTVDGVLVKTGATDYNYLGTFYANGTNTTEDSFVNRLLWNRYNARRREVYRIDPTETWNYTILTWRQARASALNQIGYMCGWAGDGVEINVDGHVLNDTASSNDIFGAIGIGVDSTSANSARSYGGYMSGSGQPISIHAGYRAKPAAGYHYYAWLEISEAANTTTWIGTAGAGYPNMQTAMTGHVMA